MNSRWLVDFDQCVFGTLQSHLHLLDERYDVRVDINTIDDVQDFWRNVPPRITEWVWGEENFDSEGFIDRFEPIPGALDALALLKERGYRVLLVTDRPQHHLPWIERWLSRYGIDIPVFSSEAVQGDKFRLARTYDISTVVEDSWRHAAAYLAQSPIDRLLLFSAPWNQGANLRPRAERMHGWDDLPPILDGKADHLMG